jgi:hypothetical protein
MVNGVNTIDLERASPTVCSRWVLAPRCPDYTIEGFYADGQVYAFEVKSPEESKANEIKYGENVGQISFTVFKENAAPKPADPPPPAEDPKEAANARALMEAQHPRSLPESPDAAKSQIKKDGQGLLGLIEPGQGTPAELRRTRMIDPGVIDSFTIYYYDPSKRR